MSDESQSLAKSDCSIDTEKDPWVVCIKGGVNDEFWEISVVRKTNEHGLRT